MRVAAGAEAGEWAEAEAGAGTGTGTDAGTSDYRYLSLFQAEDGYCGDTFSKAASIGRAFNAQTEGIYGEMLPTSFRAILAEFLVRIDERDVFYDLGSGTGKVVAQMAYETR